MVPAGRVVSEPMLDVKGLSVSYGGLHAVCGVNLEVGAGEIVGLIGPNGAGKTTVIDALSGFVAHRGRILLGTDPACRMELAGTPPHVRARAGLARTWQSGELFDCLTVAQHCELTPARAQAGAAVTRLLGWRLGRSELPHDRLKDPLAALGLSDVADARPSELPLGRQKLVGVARALAVRPRVLLLDEPAAGLDTAESQDLGRRLRALADEGLAVLLVDHDTGLVLDVCDRVYVLDLGAVIAEGAPEEVRTDSRVIEAYLGTAPGGGSDRAGGSYSYRELRG